MKRNIAALLLAALFLPRLASAQKPDPPIVDAGTIIADFQIMPAAAEAYKMTVIRLQGRITKINIRTNNGKTFADVLVTAAEKIGSSTVVDMAFPDTLIDQVKKLQVDDIVEIRTCYTEFPALGQHNVISEFIASDLKVVGHGVANAVDEKLIAWVRDNNAFGPKTGIVDDMSKSITDQLAKNNNFYITFGPGLVKDGKATILGSQDGRIYTLPLSDAQAAEMKIPKMSAGVTPTDSNLAGPLEVTMTSFALDNGEGWQSGKSLTGKITYESTRSLLHIPGDYAVRLVCADGGAYRAIYSYFAATPLPKESNTLSFTDAKEGLSPGPHVAIFQFVRVFNHTGEAPTEQVISAPKTMIIEVKGK